MSNLLTTTSLFGQNKDPKEKETVSTALNNLWSSTGSLSDIKSYFRDNEHDVVIKKVFRRLLLRHSILTKVELLTKQHQVYSALSEKFKYGILNNSAFSDGDELSGDGTHNNDGKQQSINQGDATEINATPNTHIDKDSDERKKQTSSDPFLLLPWDVRAYNLAVTDLFVEKALTYLAQAERWYKRAGQSCCLFAIFVMVIGTLFAMSALVPEKFRDVAVYIALEHIISETDTPGGGSSVKKDVVDYIKNVQNSELYSKKATESRLSFAYAFVKSFTGYGMIVGLVVALFKLGKTLLEQYEIIAERRHALRQGRLFVHLNNGKLSISELVSAFNWNSSYENAFSSFHYDAQAPMGKLSKDLVSSFTEVSKTLAKGLKDIKIAGK
ncbi:hypothetical protein JCM15519_03900 [Fundidesulfovibrio butyratiphilus]